MDYASLMRALSKMPRNNISSGGQIPLPPREVGRFNRENHVSIRDVEHLIQKMNQDKLLD